MRENKKRTKKRLNSLFCALMMVLLLSFNIIVALAEPVEAKLTVQYPYEDVTFRIYQVASFSESTGYTLVTPFSEYEDTINGLDRLNDLNAEEWRVLAYTLGQLAGTENIAPVKTVKTDSNGVFVWGDIPAGLYLILGEKTEKDGMVYTPAPILVSVPNYDVNGDWNYDVKVNHNKIEEDEKEEWKDITVIKIWLDDGNEDKRPESIKVGLYKDGKLYEVIELSIENNWRYKWENLPADAEWSIKEIEVPEGYTTYYMLNCNVIGIINSYPPEEPPTDEPTTEEPTTEEPTTEEPTTEEPTTEEPTTEEPTTEEPTTEEPTTEEPTTEEPTTEEPTTEEPTTEEPTTEGPTTEEPTTEEPTTEEPPKNEPPEKPNIPQTGQLWWPVPLLAMIGIILFTFGWVKKANGEE